MGTKRSGEFYITLSNVPDINLRIEFNDMLTLFRSAHFRRQFKDYPRSGIPIRSHFFVWRGPPEVLLTHILRDAIVKIESAVSSAVVLEGLRKGIRDNRIYEAARDPIKKTYGRGTADSVYNKLPAMLNEQFALEQCDNELYARTASFYREVRNPLFHAYQISEKDAEPVLECLEHIQHLFEWLNGWHTLNDEMIRVDIGDVSEIPEWRMRQLFPRYRLGPEGRADTEKLPDGLIQAPSVEDVEGVCVGISHVVQVTMRDESGTSVNMEMSPYAAMKMLGFMQLVREGTGWEVPEPLY